VLFRDLTVKGTNFDLQKEWVKGMKHKLRISVSKHKQDGGIVRCRTVTLRERILRALLGEKQKLMILIPGDSVETLSITEIEKEGGEENEQDKVVK